MNKDKREPIYPVELESQFILRLPEEPAKTLRELLDSEENLKNRLSIQIDNDMRHGEVRLDHWLLHGRIMDLPTIVESLKTVDRKSVYKTADICQIMVCKTEKDLSVEEESPVKNKKKDPLKVDKKYLYPHGITPPTKNVRKRRFRKTLRKKSMEGPEIEREVKRLLRADNEAVSVTWEVVQEEDEHNLKQEGASVSDKKNEVKERKVTKPPKSTNEGSKVEDIFGGALSDSDVEEDNINVEGHDPKFLSYDDQLSDTNSLQGPSGIMESYDSKQLKSEMYESPDKKQSARGNKSAPKPTSSKGVINYTEEEAKAQVHLDMQQLANELEELKLRRQRTRNEIIGMENMTLRQRFQDILLTLNRDINFKEKEYKKLQSHSK